MTELQVNAFVLAHIAAHTAGKGRPTYVRIGRRLADAVSTPALWRPDKPAS